jgi:hypothetical protein
MALHREYVSPSTLLFGWPRDRSMLKSLRCFSATLHQSDCVFKIARSTQAFLLEIEFLIVFCKSQKHMIRF